MIRKNTNSDNKFLNRELSWLLFNQRVLDEANDTKVPLIERVNFLSISASNLDEFYMVRIPSLLEVVENKPDEISNDGMTGQQQLKAAYNACAKIFKNIAVYHVLLLFQRTFFPSVYPFFCFNQETTSFYMSL